MARFNDTPPVTRRPAKPLAAGKTRTTLRKAKVLTAAQFERAIELAVARDPANALRNEALFRLSVECGLRVGEIAGLEWAEHLLDADGDLTGEVRITKGITKGTQRTLGRVLPLSPRLYAVLGALRAARPEDRFVIYALMKPKAFANGWDARGVDGGCDPNTLTQFMRRHYQEVVKLDGATSHSGRRTFITSLSRGCNLTGNSLRDVQYLAGHASISSTQEYIELTDRHVALAASLFKDPAAILAEAAERRTLRRQDLEVPHAA